MMAWEAREKGYDCNDCFLSMQNCHDRAIACEDETGLCDWFEALEAERNYQAAVNQLEHDLLYEPTYNPEDGSM